MIANRWNPLGREKYYGDKTVIEVTVTDDDTSFAFGRWDAWKYSVSGLQGHTEFTVDWGDGTSDTYTGLRYHNNNTRIYPQHTYPKGGKYIMTISNDLECFNFAENLKVTRLIQWGADVTYGCHYSYRDATLMSTFRDCDNLAGEVPPWSKKMLEAYGTFDGCRRLSGTIPQWNDVMTNVNNCYHSCRGLYGSIPQWNESITSTASCYYGCSNLTGSIPQWNDVTTNVSRCYHGCSNLTGGVPQWNDVTTNVSYCYYDCSNLTGRIPKWNDVTTNASYCYQNCSRLTGIWDSTATDDEIMPSHITSFTNCVAYASWALRSYFYTTWGGTKAVPTT